MKQYLKDFLLVALLCVPITLALGAIVNITWGDPILADMQYFYLANLPATALLVFINRNSEVNK